MKILSRKYNESSGDFKKMWDLLIEDYGARKEGFSWSLGRLCDWRYGFWTETGKNDPFFFEQNAQLWVNAFDELAGFVISESGDNWFAVITKKNYDHLIGEMVDFVESDWRRSNAYCTEAAANNAKLVSVLREKGYQTSEPSAVRSRYDLTAYDADPYLEPGFRFESIAENPDYEGKKLLQRNGFGGVNVVTKWDLTAYAFNRQSPVYNPKFDLSVVGENGRHVAGCLAFVDYDNSYAEIERVCTHSEFRRRGFNNALIAECFRRLKEENIKTAYITGYSDTAKGAYRKLCPSVETEILMFEKKL